MITGIIDIDELIDELETLQGWCEWEHCCEKWVLRAQLETMEDYKGILEHRAISEGIKL